TVEGLAFAQAASSVVRTAATSTVDKRFKIRAPHLKRNRTDKKRGKIDFSPLLYHNPIEKWLTT
ncbi:MAG: hypothetical protein ABIO24_00090, partial [Saprospiraceae bacterium]